MTNVKVVEMAVCAASPPKKSEGVQTPKGEDSFKKYLEACSQEEDTEEVVDVPKDETAKAESAKDEAAKVEIAKAEAVKNAAEAAALMLQIAPVQVQTLPVEAVPVEALEVNTEPAKSPTPAIVPVEMETSADVKAEAKVEAAPPQAEMAAPVKAEAKVEVTTFSDALKAVDVDQTVKVLAPVAPRVEAAPSAPVQVQSAAAEVVVDEKPVMKVETVDKVETAPATTASENISTKVSLDLTTTTAESRPAQLAQHLSAEIATAAATGKNSIHIQIQPENMGRIDVRLVSNSDGMQVILTTDSASTGKLLDDNLSQLQKSLSNAGLNISGLSVNSQGLQGQFSNSFQDQKSVSAHFYPNRTAVAAMPVEAIASRYSNQVSGLDFRV
ncbi:MAG: flagellar hook-length control protein FliK [Anaerolineaceae bacterium]